MIVETSLEKETFTQFLQNVFKEIQSLEFLKQARLKAWERFLTLGLPSKKTEVYRYIKLRQLFAQTFHASELSHLTADQITPFIESECEQSLLVFVNGHFCKDFSRTQNIPSQITISSLEEASQTFGAFLQNQWNKSLKDETDAFAILNSALHREGAFVYIPPKTIVKQPIQILHVIDQIDSCFALPRINIFIGAHAEVNFIQTKHSLTHHSHFVNQVVELTLEENSKVNYSKTLCEELANSWHFEAFRATLKRDATLTTVSVTEGSATVRADYRILLTGENSEALLNGLYMLKDKKEAHTNIWIEHQAPNCRSYQLFKSVVNDYSRTSFEGKILVRQAAQKTEAFQLNNNLILSDYAHADSKPNLEIFADDVKASHGATIGQLDADQLFYMQARGFDIETAKNLLIFGFCEQILDKLNTNSVKQATIIKAKSYLRK